TEVNNGLANKYVSRLAIDPTDSNTVYAGTVDELPTGKKGGLYKSRDGGNSWEAVSTGLPDWSGGVSVLVIDPTDSRTLYLGTLYEGVFKSVNGGSSWAAIN